MTAQDQLLLKPRSTGELLDQGIRLYRKNFLKFIGIIAIVQIPVSILSIISSTYTAQSLTADFPSTSPGDPFGGLPPAYFTGLAVTILLGLVSFILVSGVATAAMTRAVADNYLGRETGIMDAYRRIGRSWVSLISALIALIVLSIPLLIWVIIPCVGWITGPGLLVFLWGMVGSLIAPIIVLENLSASKALRRAWDMAKRRFWWFLGFLFILYLFNQIVVYGPIFILSFIFQLSFQQQLLEEAVTNQDTLQLIFQSLLTVVASLLYIPLRSACVTLAYFDLRVRLEGFDLALLASQSGEDTKDIAEVTSQAPTTEVGRLITWPDVGNFALLTIGAVAIYFLLVFVVVALGVGLVGAQGL